MGTRDLLKERYALFGRNGEWPQRLYGRWYQLLLRRRRDKSRQDLDPGHHRSSPRTRSTLDQEQDKANILQGTKGSSDRFMSSEGLPFECYRSENIYLATQGVP